MFVRAVLLPVVSRWCHNACRRGQGGLRRHIPARKVNFITSIIIIIVIIIIIIIVIIIIIIIIIVIIVIISIIIIIVIIIFIIIKGSSEMWEIAIS